MKRREFLKLTIAGAIGGVAGSAIDLPVKPKYPLGTRHVTSDGRVFLYVKAKDNLEAGRLTVYDFNKEEHSWPIGVPIVDIPKNSHGWVQTKGLAKVKTA